MVWRFHADDEYSKTGRTRVVWADIVMFCGYEQVDNERSRQASLRNGQSETFLRDSSIGPRPGRWGILVDSTTPSGVRGPTQGEGTNRDGVLRMQCKLCCDSNLVAVAVVVNWLGPFKCYVTQMGVGGCHKVQRY